MNKSIQNVKQETKLTPIPGNIKTYIAWKFTDILPGTFKRNKVKYSHHNYPILSPLPLLKGKTRPIEECSTNGPYIYFVLNGNESICYIGKSEENCVIKRWVRPGIGGPSSHYWTHSTETGGSVFNIADGLRRGEGPFTLRYTPLSEILPIYGKQYGILSNETINNALKLMEDCLVNDLSPVWNIKKH